MSISLTKARTGGNFVCAIRGSFLAAFNMRSSTRRMTWQSSSSALRQVTDDRSKGARSYATVRREEQQLASGRKAMPIHKDDLARLTGPDRRQFLAVLAAAGGVFVAGRPQAFADTTVNWVGWQGYDEPLKLGSFLKDNGIALAT